MHVIQSTPSSGASPPSSSVLALTCIHPTLSPISASFHPALTPHSHLLAHSSPTSLSPLHPNPQPPNPNPLCSEPLCGRRCGGGGRAGAHLARAGEVRACVAPRQRLLENAHRCSQPYTSSTLNTQPRLFGNVDRGVLGCWGLGLESEGSEAHTQGWWTTGKRERRRL